MAKFLASWDSNHYSKGKTENHTLAWFSVERGYDKTDISNIKKMKVGESLEIEKGHIIVRVS
jgi:hypothetical protein